MAEWRMLLVGHRDFFCSPCRVSVHRLVCRKWFFTHCLVLWSRKPVRGKGLQKQGVPVPWPGHLLIDNTKLLCVPGPGLARIPPCP